MTNTDKSLDSYRQKVYLKTLTYVTEQFSPNLIAHNVTGQI